MVLSVLTTLVLGSPRWMTSPSESVLEMERVGGAPLEKSSGLEISIRILPSSSALAAVSTSIETSPRRQLKTISPWRAASMNVPALPPVREANPSTFSLSAARAPIITSWPSSTSLAAIVWPTTPVPNTPIFI